MPISLLNFSIVSVLYLQSEYMAEFQMLLKLIKTTAAKHIC